MATKYLKRFGLHRKDQPDDLIRIIELILGSKGNPKTIQSVIDIINKKFPIDYYCLFTACYVGEPTIIKKFLDNGADTLHVLNFDDHPVNIVKMIPRDADPAIIKMIAEKSKMGGHKKTIITLLKNGNLEHVKAFFDNVKEFDAIYRMRFAHDGVGLFKLWEPKNLNILQAACVYSVPQIFDYLVRLPGIDTMLDSKITLGESSYSLVSFIIGSDNFSMQRYLFNGNSKEILFLRSKYLHHVNDAIFQILFFWTGSRAPRMMIPPNTVREIILNMGRHNMRNLSDNIFVRSGYNITDDETRDVIKTCFPAYRHADYVPVPESTVINSDIFVLSSAVNDKYFEISSTVSNATRFMRIITSLHYDCAIVAINRACGFTSNIISGDENRISLAQLIKKL